MLTSAVLFIIVLTSAVQKENHLTCKNLQVKIDYDSGLAFLSEKEIKDRVNFFSNNKLIGKQLSEINLSGLEKEIEKNPYVDNAEVFVDQEQKLIVEVKQKRPILRILNKDGVGYYISENNEHMPLSDKFTPYVAVASGNVEMHTNSKRDSTVQNDLYNLFEFIRKDKFLNALVDNVYVNEDGSMDIIPKISGHIIHFGNAEEKMKEKFDRLKVFYNEGFKKVGWTKYKAIDLTYDNQVVCEKRDSTKI